MHVNAGILHHYFVLQSLHKVLPSTTLYYKACTKHFPVLLCTTKLAQSPSQYYFVLQSLHKVLPSTTLYYKVCTKSFPVLFCTTKLAQSTSQYYFALQSLHKLLPSTTLYYKATSHSRRTRVQPPDPQTINGNPSLRIREKQDNLGWTSKMIKSPAQRHLTYNQPTYPPPGILHANSDQLRDLIRKRVTYPNSRVPMRSC